MAGHLHAANHRHRRVSFAPGVEIEIPLAAGLLDLDEARVGAPLQVDHDDVRFAIGIAVPVVVMHEFVVHPDFDAVVAAQRRREVPGHCGQRAAQSRVGERRRVLHNRRTRPNWLPMLSSSLLAR